ncbi:hypothetical protein RF11_13908 [Thelohanellus kitauei]|uniref:CCHC-type domain-containing protein n=1 Tax=Thelohanellus kitauei TaxID=669202 RepID=A0A0C2M1I2_THEKT|nr:hypothetical protein RF11_13908 [Thelohanellus kitauei]
MLDPTIGVVCSSQDIDYVSIPLLTEDVKDVRRWLQRFELVMESRSIKPAFWVREIYIRSTDSVLNSLELEGFSSKSEFSEVKEWLISRFEHVDSILTHQLRFRDLKQTSTETADDYAERVLSMGRKAFPSINELEPILVNQFTVGLYSDRLRAEVVKNCPDTLLKAKTVVKNSQSLAGTIDVMNRKIDLVGATAADEPIDRDQIRKIISEEINSAFKGLSIDQERRPTTYRNFRCFKCNKLGHLAKYCRSRFSSSTLSSNCFVLGDGESFESPYTFTMLVDTGAAVSLLDRMIFESMLMDIKPVNGVVHLADNSPLEVFGTSWFSFNCQGHKITHNGKLKMRNFEINFVENSSNVMISFASILCRTPAPNMAELVHIKEKLIKDIPLGVKNSVGELIMKHKVFSLNDWDIGQAKSFEHQIDTGQNLPVKQQCRRFALNIK